MSEYIKDIKLREERYLSGIAEGNTPHWPSMLNVLASVNEAFAIGTDNIIAAKQHYYIYGRLQEVAIKEYDARLFEYNIQSIGNVLLSDNNTLIRRFSDLRYNGMEASVEKGGPAIWCHTLCMFIQNNKEIAARNILLIEKNKEQLMQPDLAFFKGLYNGDKAAMTAAIQQLLEPKLHKKRNDDPMFVNVISHPALTYLKLAWYRGFEIVVDSPLIPAALLPVQPLEVYEETYEFLKNKV